MCGREIMYKDVHCCVVGNNLVTTSVSTQRDCLNKMWESEMIESCIALKRNVLDEKQTNSIILM